MNFKQENISKTISQNDFLKIIIEKIEEFIKADLVNNNEILNLLLECIKIWAFWYFNDKKLENFKDAYLMLHYDEKVNFPTQFKYFSEKNNIPIFRNFITILNDFYKLILDNNIETLGNILFIEYLN